MIDKNVRRRFQTRDFFNILHQEEFEDTKEAIRIRISKKNRQWPKEKYKRTKNDHQNIHIKLKIE
jgi:adenylate cyclase class IV